MADRVEAGGPAGKSAARIALRVGQWAFAVAVIVFAARGLATQWDKVQASVMSLDVQWGLLLLASAIVFAVYALLIHAWRRTLAEWDTKLPWLVAARIWFAAGLGKYIPGYIWSLTAMGVMARERGASGVASAGSSVIVNVLNIASGLAVALICGSQLIEYWWLVAAIVVFVIAGAALAPTILPHLTALFARMTGRTIAAPPLSHRLVWTLLFWTATAWFAYGLAFQMFANAVLVHDATSSPLLYVAVYTAAYIVGLASPIPAGFGVREYGLMEGLTQLHLMTPGDAFVVAMTSRLWLTVLELVPGLIALAIHHTTTKTTRPA